VGNRGPYRGLIGEGPDPGKRGFGRGFSGGVYGVKTERLRTGFSQIPAGEFFLNFLVARKNLENFSEKVFWKFFLA
jgi:hypothetical protein